MNNFWRNVGYPLCVLMIGGLLVRFLSPYVSNEIVIILISVVCFAFGVSLHYGKKSNGWVQKFIVAFFFLFFLFWDLGAIVLPQLRQFFTIVGINGFVIHLFYVFCGWSFFK